MAGSVRHIFFLLLAVGLPVSLAGQPSADTLEITAPGNMPPTLFPADTLPVKTAERIDGMTPDEAVSLLRRQGGDTLTSREIQRLGRLRKKEAKRLEKERKKQEKLRAEVSDYFTRVVIDTTRTPVAVDSLPRDPLLDELSIPDTEYYQQEDSAMVAEAVMLQKPPAPKEKSPSHAALLSAVVPGLGQLYGGAQWWMAPVFWGGLTGTIMAVSYYNGYYNDFRAEYRYRMFTGEMREYPFFNNQQLVDAMKNAEQQRDIWIFASVGVYLLNILHANVAVHLSEFSVQKKHRKMLELQHLFDQLDHPSPTLSFAPAMIRPNNGVSLFPAAGIRFAIAF